MEVVFWAAIAFGVLAAALAIWVGISYRKMLRGQNDDDVIRFHTELGGGG